MSSKTFVIVTLCAVAVCTVRASPISRIPLNEAVNKTLCPIKTEISSVEGRIPQHIKLIKCDEDAINECPATQPEENCCKHIGKTWRECYQLEEEVPVELKDGSLSTFKAQVGCACMMQEGSRAQEVN